MKLRDEFRETQRRWSTLGFYQRFERTALYILTASMIFSVLIALEFKYSLIVVLRNPASVVQLRSVILIALLALAPKSIIVDVHTATPGTIAALAGATLSLGLVYWLVRDQEWRAREHDPSGSTEIP